MKSVLEFAATEPVAGTRRGIGPVPMRGAPLSGQAPCCWLAGWPGAQESLDTIVIDAGYDKQTSIAIVPFRQAPELAGQDPIDEIVAFDLARSGQFEPVERRNMLSFPTERSEVFFRDWRILKTEYLVIGRVSREFDGNVSVAYELHDVSNGRLMVEDRLTAPLDAWRDLAHRISDVVYEAITGVRGAFSTRIVYVLAQNAGTSYATYRLEHADSDGARSRTLLSSDEPIMSPSWSPDGSRVAYVSFETGRPAVILQDVASGSREFVSSFSGHQRLAGLLSGRPDPCPGALAATAIPRST